MKKSAVMLPTLQLLVLPLPPTPTAKSPALETHHISVAEKIIYHGTAMTDLLFTPGPLRLA